jgi:hypothetical protein
MSPNAVESPWRAVARSWLSMKTWVKVWLFFLNFVFLTAFAFDDPLSTWTLVAYLGAGFFLFPIMYYQRGLTRFLGVAHLIPWTPLLVYLDLRLTTDWAGPRLQWGTEPGLFAWAVVLWASVAVCLGFDVFDLVRWLRGQRFVLGSAEAVRAGASLPARGQRQRH